MAIIFERPLSFSKQGQRQYNEDFFLPIHPQDHTKLFVLCDGMGGLDKGEDASKITATSINQYFEENLVKQIDLAYLQKAINAAHEALEDFMTQHPLISKMGTTLTLLDLRKNTITMAHVGDSRIYHIRDGQILYQSKDHKQVLDMVESGIITAEQAVNHPWRNRLSRSVSVRTRSSIDDSSNAQDKPDIYQTEDILVGDYFFMCTDGVLEQINNKILCQTLFTSISNEAKLNTLLSCCEDKTKDNYSGFLIQVKEKNNLT